jgi:hypothetical protein
MGGRERGGGRELADQALCSWPRFEASPRIFLENEMCFMKGKLQGLAERKTLILKVVTSR